MNIDYDFVEKSSFNSAELQNCIKKSLNFLKLRGLKPKDATKKTLGIDYFPDGLQSDWIDVEYYLYWEVKRKYMRGDYYNG